LRYLAALLACFCIMAPAQADILIGVAGPLSGPNAIYGNELKTGVTAAIAEVNAAGGINGEALALVDGDDGCDAKRAVDVAKTFVSRDVRMVVGHFCSSSSLAAAATYNTAGILMFNASVTAPDLTSRNLWNVFRLTGRDDAQGALAASRIKSDNKTESVFVITDGQADTAAITKQFLAGLPTAKTVTIKSGNVKLPDDPALILASAIYLALQSQDAGDTVKALRALSTGATLYGPDFLQSETFSTRAGPAADGTRVSFLQDNLPRANPSKLAKLSTNEGTTIAAFAAVEVFTAAAKARTVNDARAMASFLTSGSEVPTIIGSLRFTATGDLQQQPYVWYQWSGGALRPE
jgi:branched-chain amino acid transport system substrate-binding protein